MCVHSPRREDDGFQVAIVTVALAIAAFATGVDLKKTGGHHLEQVVILGNRWASIGNESGT